MSNRVKALALISALLGMLGAWLIGYSVIDKFDDREFGNVGFGGDVKRTPAYDAWLKRNDARTWWGLWAVTASGALQVVVVLLPPKGERKRP